MEGPERTRQRARYVHLRMAARDHGRAVLEAEMTNCEEQLARLRPRLLNAVETLQQRPGGWLGRWQRGRSIESQAEADFHALASLPQVAAIEAEPATRALVITTTSGPGGDPPPLRLRLGLADGSLELAPEGEPVAGLRARMAEARQAALEASAAAHIGTGDLAGLLVLAMGLTAFQRVSSVEPHIDPAARLLYVRYRQRLLVHCHAEDEALRVAEEELSHLGDTVARLTRRACQIARCLGDLDEADDRSTAAYGVEFDVLCDLPEIDAITVERGTLRALTRPLTAPYDGRAYELGRFQIDLRPPGLLQIRNLDHPVLANGGRRYEHPHVANSGFPCAGNVSGFLHERLGRYEFPAVLMQTIALLESYNPDNPFVRLELHWTPVGRTGTAQRPAAS